MGRRELVAKVIRRSGSLSLLDRWWGKERLTVLAYHRVGDYDLDTFPYFAPNISATTAMFRRQMAYVAEHFNVIDLHTLRDYVRGQGELPDRPLLITFDDGYYDNYASAAPILREFNFPAVIFIVTGRMDDRGPLWWDEVAYYFHTANTRTVTLPLIGQVSLVTPDEKGDAMYAYSEALKRLPEDEKRDYVAQLPELLGSAPLQPAAHQMFMNWDQVRELWADNIVSQPHTHTHPILTRIPLESVRHELETSAGRIKRETGHDAFAFAYPNGQPTDYSPDIMQIMRELNFDLGFTLSAGPMPRADIRQHPLQIRRVFLSMGDTFDIFAAKVMGIPALIDRPTYKP